MKKKTFRLKKENWLSLSSEIFERVVCPALSMCLRTSQEAVYWESSSCEAIFRGAERHCFLTKWNPLRRQEGLERFPGLSRYWDNRFHQLGCDSYCLDTSNHDRKTNASSQTFCESKPGAAVYNRFQQKTCSYIALFNTWNAAVQIQKFFPHERNPSSSTIFIVALCLTSHVEYPRFSTNMFWELIAHDTTLHLLYRCQAQPRHQNFPHA